MNHFKKITPLALLILISMSVSADYYRYRDENGQMHITFALTAEAIQRGYDIINNQGLVIETVAPVVENKDGAMDSAEQRAADLRLLSTYGDSSELVLANERRLESSQLELDQLSGRLKDTRDALRSTEDRAGLEERQTGSVSESTLGALEQYRQLIDDLEATIVEHEAVMASEQREFEKDLERLQQLLGEDETRPLTP
jgi:chromosome segregation ATPase